MKKKPWKTNKRIKKKAKNHGHLLSACRFMNVTCTWSIFFTTSYEIIGDYWRSNTFIIDILK